MSSITQRKKKKTNEGTKAKTHALNVYNYLSRKVGSFPGVNTIRSLLLSKHLDYIKTFSNCTVDSEIMCPFCYAFWGEGNFSIKICSQKKKKNRRKEKKSYVLKCFNCSKCSNFELLNSKETLKKSHIKPSYKFSKSENSLNKKLVTKKLSRRKRRRNKLMETKIKK